WQKPRQRPPHAEAPTIESRITDHAPLRITSHQSRITDSAMKASEIKKGNVVEYNNGVYQIRDIERSSPQGRGGNVRYRFIMYSVPGGTKLDASFDADDQLTEVELLRRQASFSYKDGDAFVFLDDED